MRSSLHPPPCQAPRALTSSCLSPLSCSDCRNADSQSPAFGRQREQHITAPMHPDLPGRLRTGDRRQPSRCRLNPLCAPSSTSFPVTPSPPSKVNPSLRFPGELACEFASPLCTGGKQGERFHAEHDSGMGRMAPPQGCTLLSQRQGKENSTLTRCQAGAHLTPGCFDASPAIQTPSPPSRAGGVRAPAGSWHPQPYQGRCAVTAASRNRAARPASPSLSSPLPSCQHGAAGAAAGPKSETAKGWFFGAVGMVSSAA